MHRQSIDFPPPYHSCPVVSLRGHSDPSFSFVARPLPAHCYVCNGLQGAAKIDEARVWMKENTAAHANSKQIDQTNRQLHTSLRREMERAKQVSPISTHLPPASPRYHR